MFVFDTSHDPLLLQVVPAAFSHEAVDAHFREIEAYLGRRKHLAPVAIMADTRGNITSNARHRQRAALFLERMSNASETRCVGHAVVMDNAVVRGALTAVLWVKSPPWPIKVFGTMEEADQWLRHRFVEEGLPPPDAPLGWWAFRGTAKIA